VSGPTPAQDPEGDRFERELEPPPAVVQGPSTPSWDDASDADEVAPPQLGDPTQPAGTQDADWPEDADDDASRTALPPRLEGWRRRSAAGAILTGFALGLQQALEPKRDQPAIVVQTSGDPPRDLPVEADFEYGRPRQAVVNLRPWLLGDSEDRAHPDSGDSPGPVQPPSSDDERGSEEQR